MYEPVHVQQKISAYAAEEPVVRLALQKRCPNDFEAKDPLQKFVFYLGVDLIRDVDKSFPSFFDLFGQAILLDLNRIVHEDVRPWSEDTYRMVYEGGLYVEVHIRPTEYMLHYATDPERIGDFFVLVDKETQWPLTRTGSKEVEKEEMTSEDFDASIDLFFLYVLNAAKGLVRKYPFKAFRNHAAAHDILYKLIRQDLYLEKGPDAPLGCEGEQMHKFMEPELWDLYQKTLPTFDYDRAWQALFNSLSLFRKVGMHLAQKRGYTYPKEMDVGMVQLIRSLWQSVLDASF